MDDKHTEADTTTTGVEATTKTILCFGDSNTWGFIPGTAMHRFPPDARWPGVVASELGSGWDIIEEGLCGRTTSFDDPCWEDRNGRKQLGFLLESHMPLDLVVIMLGTNDLKHYLGLAPNDIALGAATLVDMVQQSTAGRDGKPPEVLLVAPAEVTETANPFGHKFDAAIAKSQEFATAFAEIATEYGIAFFDAATVAKVPDTDGIHLDRAAHLALGKALADVVARVLQRQA